MECANCHSDSKDLWGPIFPQPILKTIENGNYISIQICEICRQLWVHSPYEPYLSFPYLVKWGYTVEDWILVHGKDNGQTLLEWHKLEIKGKLSATTQSDLDAIEKHRGRSYFHWNPIDLPSIVAPSIAETIMNLKSSRKL